MNFVEELKWRGMVHEMMPGTEEYLSKDVCGGYIGFDPTADSLHIGHLVSVMILRHFQRAGHRPIALIGGATGMIGDPSMKSAERNLLDEETLRRNQEAIGKQLAKFLDFESDKPNKALLVNNYDWMKNYSFLNFIRDIGKYITVNYMMAKDSVKVRLSKESSAGLSFTEFSYQLLQAYDYLYLYENEGVRLQMGGTDQWGNITTGTELIRKKTGQSNSFALVCPLITKADGGKFGKTESGNIWLDKKYTSPYKFYQFWLNISDADAKKYIKIFTSLTKQEIDKLIEEHDEMPNQRILQKKLAEEVTTMVHSEEDFRMALEVSQILFGNATADILNKIDEDTFLQVFEGVTIFEIDKNKLENGIPIIELLSIETNVFPSKSECRKTIQANGVSINKQKVKEIDQLVDGSYLIANKYIILQKGKKNYFLIKIV